MPAAIPRSSADSVSLFADAQKYRAAVAPVKGAERAVAAIDNQEGYEENGDIYILGKFENTAAFQNVGVIVNAEGSDWTTADGGQGNGWQSGFVRRRFHPSGQIDGEFGNKAMLRGWVNLDALFAVAISTFPANL